MDVSNLLPISEFKVKYALILEDEEINSDNCLEKIRMFAMGKELKDDLFIYSYDIMNESTVQAMIKK